MQRPSFSVRARFALVLAFDGIDRGHAARLIRADDRALYPAKKNGRDRVETARDNGFEHANGDRRGSVETSPGKSA
jgi:hypothetical protein